ncbi:MAG: ChaN family lipoprotein [Gallionella sp.]
MKITAHIKLILTISLLSFTSLAQAQNMLFTDHPLAGKIWDMNSRSFIDEATLLVRINDSNVLLLGEVHDNVLHHELQQKLLQARIDSGAKPALMMEQIDASSQPALDQALAGIKRDDVLSNVNILVKFTDWQLYSPLLAIAVDNRLPIIAANIPNQQLQPVIWKGYAAYDANELKRLAVEAVWSDNRQKFLSMNMGGAHCGQLKDELREGLTRSQRLKDALMVDSAVSSISRGVVALIGSSHARRDIGLPLYFAARDPSSRIVSIGFVEVSPDRNDPKTYVSSATGQAPFDLIWFTPRMERTDPCAEFNKPKEAAPSASEPETKPASDTKK